MNSHPDEPQDPLTAAINAVLRSAAGRPITLADDRRGGWLGEALDQAKDLARDHLGSDLDELDFALDAIARLKLAETVLGGGGLKGFQSVMRLLYVGSGHQARKAYLYWLDDKATFAERRELQNAASVEAHRQRIEREMAWESIRATLADIGAQTLKVVIPILLAGL